MISPDQVDHLQEQIDNFRAALVIGCLFFAVGGTQGIFASQEFANGTDFMMRLAGTEQGVGFLLIVVGWIKVHSLTTELDSHASSHQKHE
jgi:hypothetical protein